jgi:phosphoglycerol transferase MdoB-like AlkP superfamily enzyme
MFSALSAAGAGAPLNRARGLLWTLIILALSFLAVGLFVVARADFSRDATYAFFTAFQWLPVVAIGSLVTAAWALDGRGTPAVSVAAERSSGPALMSPDLPLFVALLGARILWVTWRDFTLSDIGNIENHSLSFTVGSCALLALPAFWMHQRPRMRRIFLFLIDAFATLILLADILYDRVSEGLPSVVNLVAAAQLPMIWESLLFLMGPREWLLAATPFLWLVLLARRSFPVPFAIHGLRSWELGFGLIVFAATMMVPGLLLIRQSAEKNHVTVGMYGPLGIVNGVGLWGYHLIDLHMNLAAGRTVSDADIAAANAFFAGRRNESDPRLSPYWGCARGYNVVVILGESVQDFVIGGEWNGVEITPSLNRLHDSALVRGSFFDITGIGRTSDAEFAALHSLAPIWGDMISLRFQGNRFRGIPKILGERYETIISASTSSTLWNMRRAHARYGFQKAFYGPDWGAAEAFTSLGFNDIALFERTGRAIPSFRSPFFLYILSLDGHMPFEIGDSFKEMSLGSLEGKVLGDYFHAARHLDNAVRRLLNELEKSGRAESTVIVFFGDHDAGMTREQLRPVKDRLAPDTSSARLIDKIPFFILVPGSDLPPVEVGHGTLMDLAPTLLTLLGVDGRDGWFMGRDLASPRTLPAFLPDGSATDGRLFLDANGGNAKCVDLSTYESVSGDACADLERQGAFLARVSRTTIFGDLVRER